MKQLAKRGLAMLTAFVLVISLMPAMHHHTAHAAGNEVEYVYSSDGKYIYNWGTRGDTATFLSPKAEEFYTGNYIYDVLSATPGGTSASTAPNSALYDALQELMSSKQTYQTSYDATRDLYRYTDCEGSAKVSDKISCFYSGAPIGPDWDGGNTWNREHTWPNSKGDASGNGENDIMMLRPASMVANSSRGNKAYGESSSYYYPNVESNDKYDVRGDVARIMLYVYVRWGNTERMWGSDGVIESLDVLLNWMEADPVDTWELGRNDSVQSITGTRNVFVDYPEFAFMLFGAEIPENMTTPSGEAENTVTCQHNYVAGEVVAATCTAEGYTVYTCSLCGRSYHGDTTPAIAHSYADGKCTVCGKDEPLYVVDAPVAGTAYKFGMIQQNVSAADVYYLTGAMDGYYMATTTDDTNAIDVYLENTTGGYHLYTAINGIKTYINMVVNGTYVNGAYEATASTVYIFDETSKTVVAQVNGATYWFGTRNDKTYTTVGPCDVSYNGFYCQFYGEITEDDTSTGLRKDEDGTWRYYVDGEPSDYTGLVEHTDGKTYYVYCGVVPMDYVGLYNHTDGKIYYIYYGVAVKDYVGLYAHTNGTVYYIDNGTISTTYTGLYAHSDGNTYYVYNGVIPTNYVGLCYHTDGKTYYIYKGVAVSSYTGLYNHTDGKVYYINAGVIDPAFVGLYTHTTGATYYVYNGVVLTGYVGLYLHTDGYVYYVYNGVLVPSYEGFYFHTDGNLYYMYEGVIAVDYTGLALHSDGKLYYVVSGVFDPTFNGTATDKSGTEYEVVNGIAQP